ncbi:MAG: hypothetical protein DRH24_00755 [Deltaproteobacteria bacterium]|nr:MAG: hypothetical protein DRH24_00755 [Deltaproteobacteria bacterium]
MPASDYRQRDPLGRAEKGTRTLKYRIKVKKSAVKEIKKITKPNQKRISEAIGNLAETLPNFIKKWLHKTTLSVSMQP